MNTNILWKGLKLFCSLGPVWIASDRNGNLEFIPILKSTCTLELLFCFWGNTILNIRRLKIAYCRVFGLNNKKRIETQTDRIIRCKSYRPGMLNIQLYMFTISGHCTGNRTHWWPIVYYIAGASQQQFCIVWSTVVNMFTCTFL